MALSFNRRSFLRSAAGTIGAVANAAGWRALADRVCGKADEEPSAGSGYPRRFSGRQLGMISFPLGGVGAGSIGLGGRGQLINWEIFNRPNKGYRPLYALPAIWVRSGERTVARVLEARILPPYEGQEGLGSSNAPGLSRLDGATFAGAYPLAHIDFKDPSLPVTVELDAFSPFIPHEADDSGLPVAVLRYTLTNRGDREAEAAIAFSIDNPVMHPGPEDHDAAKKKANGGRRNELRSAGAISGLFMTNPALADDDPMRGDFVLAARAGDGGTISHWLGWPEGRWWNSPQLFWEQFSKSGEMGSQPDPHSVVGVVSLKKTIPPGRSEPFEFLLGWRFPNRTPEWCGWTSPEGEGRTVIGNFYATRFADSWEAVLYTADRLPDLEARTRLFADTLAESTLPAAVRDAASANLSTLASTTCFRTADGEFHTFEGSFDATGSCFGNCLHVWNYETATPFLFPSLARSLRRSAFGYSMDDRGAMHFRQLLPDGKARFGIVAADGQMGQILHAWLDWKISGDDALLRRSWPPARRALEFAWVPGGWDADQDGVFEGVQHNTYDVEFYGPNPMCGIYYLGALRAGEEMARAAGETAAADRYRLLFERGSRWIDSNLFNGEYYVQQVRGVPGDRIAAGLRSSLGAEDSGHPEYQVGEGCLVDQLVGQYLADVGGLGPLLSPEKIRTALQSIYRYNYKPSVAAHDNMARTYVLNDEAAVVVCDYARAERPRIPFPYHAEVWTGLEYTLASLLIGWGMVRQGLQVIESTRLRYDGERRNPWDEAECGHHYARAMSSWSTVIALSGFRYDGRSGAVRATPPGREGSFRCLWATGTGWGRFSLEPRERSTVFTLKVLFGGLRLASCELAVPAARARAESRGRSVACGVEQREGHSVVRLAESMELAVGEDVRVELEA